MFIITYVAALLSVILLISAAILMFSQNNAGLSRLLALYALVASLWIGGNAAADVAYTVPFLVFASGVAFISGALSILLFLLIVDLLIDNRMPPVWRSLCYAIPTVGITLGGFSKLAIVDTYFPANAPAQILPGPLYLATLVIMVLGLGYCLSRLMLALSREENETRRIQLSYVLLGLMLMLLGGLVFDVVLPLLGELRFYTLGPMASIFFILSTGYAITRYRLIDIRIVVQRGMVYSFLLALIIATYASILSLAFVLFPLTSEAAMYVSTSLVVIAGILGAPVIEKYFRRLTDSLFFKQTYDYAEAIHVLSEIIYRYVELPELVNAAEQELARILRTRSVRIVYGKEKINISDYGSIGNEYTIVVPIRVNDSCIGSIYADGKKSGDPYTRQDRKLLSTFAYQAATAFSRAELYEQTRQHARKLEETVKERTQELRAIQAQERRMLIDLSHNLQTPLAIFQARLEQLKSSMLTGTDIRSLEQPIKRLSGFIYDLLAFAKLESEPPREYTDVAFSCLVDEIVEELGVIAKSKGVEISSSIEPELHVNGDEKRLREAILNVASNAVRYMREDGERRINLSLIKDMRLAYLVIADTGHGIAPHDLPHVFERFYRSRHTAGSADGSGLGLAVVKRIVEQHGGSVAIESIEGNGTSVHFQIPLV